MVDHGRMTIRSDRPWRLFAGLVSLVLVCSACSTAAQSAGHSTPSSAAPPSSSAPSSEPDAKSKTKVAKPADPPAPATYRAVVRNGKRPTPTVAAAQGSFSKSRPVTYPDGISLAVTKVVQSVEKGFGPGVYPGRPHTALSLLVTNKSTRSITLNQVVVSAAYGSPARLASAVYEDPAAKDFAGSVKPGASATATYVFSISRASLSSVVCTVDFDSVHVAARFRGSAT